MITIFTPSFADDDDTNAQNLTVKAIVARLPSDQFQVVMFCEKGADPRIAARPNTRLLPWRRRGNTLRTLWQCLQQVPDVYFYPREGPLDAAFLQLRSKLHLRTRVVTHVVSGGLYRGAIRPAVARNICQADAVFCNSHYLAQLVSENLQVKAGTIHNGIDRRYFYPACASGDNSPGDGSQAQALTVLFAGSFRPYKRVHLVVHQAARLPQVHFRLAGIGEEEQRCRSLAAELGCANVEFLGHIPQRQLGEEMRRSDIFFFPSDTEGHPQVLGQAAACGLPVIALNVYRPDYVVNGESGCLVESDEEMAQKLDLLIARPDLRESMREAAIAHASKFDWDAIAVRWQQVFQELVAGRRNH
ncbi:MAG TPA: glycosyltransferase [Candidatus Sulfotelmatobacter sp.]